MKCHIFKRDKKGHDMSRLQTKSRCGANHSYLVTIYKGTFVTLSWKKCVLSLPGLQFRATHESLLRKRLRGCSPLCSFLLAWPSRFFKSSSFNSCLSMKQRLPTNHYFQNREIKALSGRSAGIQRTSPEHFELVICSSHYISNNKVRWTKTKAVDYVTACSMSNTMQYNTIQSYYVYAYLNH
jgi:hypothetical protein